MTVHQMALSGGGISDLLAARAEASPALDAFVDGDRRLTFGEWQRSSAAVAARLADVGVRRGDVVCLVLPSSIDYAVCYQAIAHLGAITSGINPRLGPGELASVLVRTAPVVTIVDPGVSLPEGASGGAVIERGELEAMIAAGGEAPTVSVRPTDPVAIVWTSGTTGVPKGAVFDHECLRAMAAGAGALSEPGDRRLSPLPFAHVGYMTRPWDEIAMGITTVITPTPWRAVDALRLIEAERVTVGQGVPAQWSLMLAAPEFDSTNVSSLRLAATGAAPVPPELVRTMRSRLGCPVIVRYASTEASLATGSRPDDGDMVIATTVGRPSGGVEMQVVDEGGRASSRGQVGMVQLRSRAMMRGYWRDDAATAAAINADGWLSTGDLGSVDGDGNLTLVGRRVEMYIRGGYNIYPAEVEAVLSDHPSIDRVAVVGMPDPVLGQIGVAFAVVSPGAGEPTLDELRSWIRLRLADYKSPDRLVIVEELPLTSMLKIDKRALASDGAVRVR